MKVPTVRFEKVLRPTHLSHCRCSGVHECPISITSEPQSRKTRIPQPSAACLQPRPPQAEALWPKLQLFSFARLSMCTSIHRPYLPTCLPASLHYPPSQPSIYKHRQVCTDKHRYMRLLVCRKYISSCLQPYSGWTPSSPVDQELRTELSGPQPS